MPLAWRIESEKSSAIFYSHIYTVYQNRSIATFIIFRNFQRSDSSPPPPYRNISFIGNIGEINSRFRAKFIACTWTRICILLSRACCLRRANFRSGMRNREKHVIVSRQQAFANSNASVMSWRTWNSTRVSRKRQFQSRVHCYLPRRYNNLLIN